MKRVISAIIVAMLIAAMAITASAANITLNTDEFRQCGGYAFFDENGKITHGSSPLWSSVENKPTIRYDITNGLKIEVSDIHWSDEGNTAITMVVGTPPSTEIDPSERTWIAISGHIVFILKKDGSVFMSDGASSILGSATPLYDGRAIEGEFDSFTFSIVRGEANTSWLVYLNDTVLIEYEDKYEGYETTRYGVYPVALTNPDKITLGFGVLNGDALAADVTGNIDYTVSAIKFGEALTVNQKAFGVFTGETVKVSAPAVEGKTFTGWNAEGIELGDKASEAEFEFEMPANAVKLSATYDGEEIDFTTTTGADSGSVAGTTDAADGTENTTTDSASDTDESKDGGNNAIVYVAIGAAVLIAVAVVAVVISKKKS